VLQVRHASRENGQVYRVHYTGLSPLRTAIAQKNTAPAAAALTHAPTGLEPSGVDTIAGIGGAAYLRPIPAHLPMRHPLDAQVLPGTDFEEEAFYVILVTRTALCL
jgi:hypothetical protein